MKYRLCYRKEDKPCIPDNNFNSLEDAVKYFDTHISPVCDEAWVDRFRGTHGWGTCKILKERR